MESGAPKGRAKGLYAGAIFLALVAFILLCIAINSPDWLNTRYRNETETNKTWQRNKKQGLFQFSVGLNSLPGKCTNQACLDAWTRDEEVSEADCKKWLRNYLKNDRNSDCTYYFKGYCRCPWPKDDYTTEFLTSPSMDAMCKKVEALYGDGLASSGQEYGREISRTLIAGAGLLIASAIGSGLAFLLLILAHVKCHWKVGLVGVVCTFLALLLGVIGLVITNQYVVLAGYRRECGSIKEYDRLDATRSENSQQVITTFNIPQVLTVVAIISTFLSFLCAIGGTLSAKKIRPSVAMIEVGG